MGFRTDFRTGVFSVLQSFKVANPNLVTHVYDHTPPDFNTPLAFVDKAVSERIQHTSGLRIRTATVDVVVMNKQSTNDQVADEQDALLDGLLDALTAAYNAVTGCVIEPIAVADDERERKGTFYPCVVITVQGIEQRGRT